MRDYRLIAGPRASYLTVQVPAKETPPITMHFHNLRQLGPVRVGSLGYERAAWGDQEAVGFHDVQCLSER